jgi:hypothetical protein
MRAHILVSGSRLGMLIAAVACSESAVSPQAISAAGMSADVSGSAQGPVMGPAKEDRAPGGGSNSEAIDPGSLDHESTPAAAGLSPPAPPVAAISDASVPVGDTSIDAGVTAEEWKVLFNGQNLDGWTAARGGGAGQTAQEIFQVTDGMIHVYKGAVQGSTQPNAALRTNESYSSYVLHLEYMWGTARFSNQANTERDSGILFHVFNDLNLIWPDSFEFQMGSSEFGGNWISGDIFAVDNNVRGQTSSIQSGGNFVFAELANGGMRRPIGAPTFNERGRTNVQLDMPGWNVVELTVRADTEAEYKLNGIVVNRVFDMEGNTGGVWQPLQSGPIALQAEYAEVFFRDIRLLELP